MSSWNKDKEPYVNIFVHSYSDWNQRTSVKKYIYPRLYSTLTSDKLSLSPELRKKSVNINAWFITGFTDAEGCFSIRVRKTTKTHIGWHIEAVFSINLHLRDLSLLKEIQSYFGGIGRISEGKKNCAYFVSSIKDLTTVIIPHFAKYPLITQKQGDFLLFKSVVYMVNAKEHLTMEGLQKIVSCKASINLGLTDVLKTAFPNTMPALRYLAVYSETLDPYWVAGFASGEGCFSITENRFSSKIYVRLVFSVSTHSRDECLIRSLVAFFGCGAYCPSSLKRNTVSFQSYKFSDNYEKIIPFFREYKIRGIKSKDFEDWCKVAEIIQSKDHLTKVGFDLICLIKSGINKGR